MPYTAATVRCPDVSNRRSQAGRIEDYALIGDMQTAALVRRNGAVEWLCLPRFDSHAVFAGLLGTEEHGFWRLGPARPEGVVPPSADRRRYRGDSLVLESEWDTSHGTAVVSDFMPSHHGPPRLIRVVEGVKGRVLMRSSLRPRFGYGRIKPSVVHDGPRIVATAGPDALWLDTLTDPPTTTRAQDGTIVTDFTIEAGQQAAFTLSWGVSYAAPPPLPEPEAALETTKRFWRGWTAKTTYTGPYEAAVRRSLITLKGLTYAPTGGIVAAATTSLPEEIGGPRNWDYRFTWLRDAAFTLSSLLRTGHLDEAHAWREWLLRAVAGDPENLQIMYGVAGERQLPETELDWLPGYENSRPVQVGNGAAGQFQLDVYGEVAEMLYIADLAGLSPDDRTLDLLLAMARQVCRLWKKPDEGIWEIRGEPRHFVHSKVMAWVALDRIVKMLRRSNRRSEERVLAALQKQCDIIHEDVCARGYDQERNTFIQSYGSHELDASLLHLLLSGFLSPDDKRAIGTVESVQRELATPDGFLRRYHTAGADVGMDGLPGDEGAFLICSYWLVEALAVIGRRGEARTLFERLLRLANDVGLLAEEYDPIGERLLGNFPQAFSHIGLVHAALALDPPPNHNQLISHSHTD
ncbi:glycoside hydrolase family 15 protein [Streptomyces sp. NBC_00846]|uniref:glycoside hydrolase family 15 protein n=1 Tax=Streptomyces sp. NBC_00846 TaxID=2975849 RepID=UPI003863967E|nr:glycoside hydrolase family 15 protein [Streptomyces sp. NBC_00846]